ncbi:MAG: hypothetical protein ACYDHA_00825 [Bellilinea sp.]
MRQFVILEWTFTPSDYFEEEVEVQRDDYILLIGNGKAEAKVKPDAFDADLNYRLTLHEALNDRFLAIQVLTHQSYNLSKPSMYRLQPDGRRDVTLFLDPGQLKITPGHVDFIHKDKDGNVLADTRRDRIVHKEQFATLVEKYRKSDEVLESLLRSYDAAVRDPDNELVHLFEIKEAVQNKFGGEVPAMSALGISNNKFSRLRILANVLPLKQGRHRGLKVGILRDATIAELIEARFIARLIIERYLLWIEKEYSH